MSAGGERLVPHVFGIRHLSPAGAVHLEALLDRVSPEVVALEAPSGAERELQHLVHPETRPPVALLAFTRSRPVHTFTIPLAVYSPEWVACRWAITHGRPLVFMDLPAEVFLGLEARERPEPEAGEAPPVPTRSAWEELALRSGAPDVETWWERTFEHLTDPLAYQQAMFALGEGLREHDRSSPAHREETLLREAFMRRTLRALLQRHPAEKIVAVCGAFHAPVLTTNEPWMTDAQLAALPRAETVLTLMPYSHARLHERTGYGAGNHAPRYFESLYRELAQGHPDRLAPRFLAKVCRQMRREGVMRSSAQVIDAVRLAHAMAALADSPAVTLRDLRDAAYTCLGAGEAAPVALALEAIETGTAIGKLPPGVSRTALQDDFRFQVARLKLDKLLTENEELLELDLREDRYAKSEAAARLDFERSIFLQQLRALEIPLARENAGQQTAASWKERWLIRWTPAAELKLAELSLVGDSIAGATSFVLSGRLATSRGAGEAAEVLSLAARCRLADALERARARVQEAATQDDDLSSVAAAVARLVEVARYGGLRAVDPEPLWPLIAQLFLRGALLASTAVACDAAAVPALRTALVQLATAASQEPGRVAVEVLEQKLREIALGDAGHPHQVGVCTALLLERGKISDPEVDGSVGRRLNPGEAPEAAAAFFEGLSAHNRMALFARRSVWESLSRFVDSLDGKALLGALAPLRRAFGEFAPGEVRRVVSALGEVWGAGQAELARTVEKPIAAAELEALNLKLGDLGDLDL